MRFVSRVFATATSALVLLGAFGVFRAVPALAQEATPASTDPAAGYTDIVGGPNGEGAVGLIFANICSGPAPAEGTPDSCDCRDHGECSLDDILQVFVNITILILGISGSAILLMFIYGGFLWVTSRGDAKRIEKGKETVTNAVIGFAIILLSYSMINFLIAALAGDQAGDTLEETIDNAQDGNPDLNTTTSP